MVRQKEADRNDPDEAGKAGERKRSLGKTRCSQLNSPAAARKRPRMMTHLGSTRMKAAVTETPAMRSPMGMEKPGLPSP